MPIRTYFAPIALGVFLFVFIALLYFININAQDQKKKNEDVSRQMSSLQPNIQRSLETSGFTNKAYVLPLKSNASGSLYSSRVQIRGVIVSWKNDSVRVKVNESVFEIRLPVAVKLYCPPSSFIEQDGQSVPATAVALDFSRSPAIGTLMAIDNISRRVPKGKDIAVLANVGNGDVMTAYLVVGYGCGEK